MSHNTTGKPERGPANAITVRPVLVSDILTAPVHTAGPDWTLSQAAAAMMRHGITALPVVDDRGALIGIITEADLMTERLAHGHAPGRTSVRDAMTRDVLTVTPTLDLESALARLVAGGRRALPVVDGRRIVGILTRSDIISRADTTEKKLAPAAGPATQSSTCLSRAQLAGPPTGVRPATRPRTKPREMYPSGDREPEERWENEGGSL